MSRTVTQMVTKRVPTKTLDLRYLLLLTTNKIAIYIYKLLLEEFLLSLHKAYKKYNFLRNVTVNRKINKVSTISNILLTNVIMKKFVIL